MSNDYASREQAIAEAPENLGLEPGDIFFTAHLDPVEGAEMISFDANDIIERAKAYADENWGDDASEEVFDGVTPAQERELEQELEAVTLAWMARHNLQPVWYQAEDVESHCVPPALDALDRAAVEDEVAAAKQKETK